MAAKSGGGAASSVRVPTKTSIKDSVKTSLKKVGLTLRIANILKAQGTIGGCPLGNVVIVKDSLDHFEVKVMPDTAATKDTVAFTEGAKLVIQAKDKENKNVELDVNSLLKFSLLTNEEYGTFINANNDTLRTTPVQLTDVKYSDAKDGKIKFAAVKKNPDSLVTCRIRIELQNDAKKKGDTAIVVVGKHIKLTVQHTVLKPLGDSDNKGPKTARVIDYSKVKSDTVTISVRMPNGDPVPDYPFTLSAYVRPNSGGHDHTDNRPTGKFIHSTDTVKTFSDKTGSDGTAKYKYLCSGIGGIDSLYVKGKTDKDTSTTIILLKMGDFEELTAGEHYLLVGSTDDHIKNHFGRDGTITRLKEIADSVYAKFAVRIQYNDMSLIYGGPFDCRSDHHWNTPHQNHREGTNVDVRPTIKLEWLQKIFARNNWGKILEEDKGGSNHHYHFTIQ
jgi:hypothetical protein